MAEKTPVLRIDPDELPERVLVMGDPARARQASEHLDDTRLLGSFREYTTYRGRFEGVDVAVASHGVGSSGAVIAFEELAQAGARFIIRTGTCGGIAREVQDGDLVVVAGAVRADGVTDRLLPVAFPALASVDAVVAIREAISGSGRSAHEGVVLTTSLFYPGPVLSGELELWHTAGAIAVEMECAALFINGFLNGLKTGALLTVDGNPIHGDENYDPHRQVVYDAVEDMIGLGLSALVHG